MLLPSRPTRWLLPLASVAYVATFAVWVDGGTEPRAWLLGIAGVVLALVGARRASAVGRALGWGLAVVVASLGADAPSRGLAACGDVGAATCIAAACLALARLPSSGGVVAAVKVSPVA